MPFAEPTDPVTVVPGDIRGEWQVTTMTKDGEDVPLPDGVEGTLVVEERRLSGVAFCNGFGGAYRLDDGRLRIEDLATTLVGCTGGVGRAEGVYLSALNGRPVQVALDGDDLVLVGEGAELRFRPRPPVLAADLTDAAWMLVAVTSDGLETIALGSPAPLEFRADGTFTAGTGCGSVTGTWDAGADGVRSSVVGHETDCTPELTGQDTLVASVLDGGFEADIRRGRLNLSTPEGQRLAYEPA